MNFRELQNLVKAPEVFECGCVGPQNGQPLCPCAMRMRGLYERDGHWIEPEHDHGPVKVWKDAVWAIRPDSDKDAT